MFSISLSDVEVNEFSEVAEVFVETLNGLLSRLGGVEGGSIASAEACISEVLSKCGQALLELHARVSETMASEVSDEVFCPKCTDVCRRYRRRGRRGGSRCRRTARGRVAGSDNPPACCPAVR